MFGIGIKRLLALILLGAGLAGAQVLQPVNGGTGKDSSAWTGCPTVTAGVWTYAACTTGSGTVGNGTQYQLANYPGSGTTTAVAGTVGLTYNGTTLAQQTVLASEYPALGSNLLSCSDAWTLGSGWSGTCAGGFTGSSASGTVVDSTFTPSSGSVLYAVTLAVSSYSAGSIDSVTLAGGAATLNLTANGTYTVYLLKSSTTGKLTFSSTGFSGVLSAIAVQIYSASVPTWVISDSTGVNNIEVRSSPAAAQNTFFGVNAGSLNDYNPLITTGYANTAFGNAALQKNTDGYDNTAVGEGALLNNTINDDNTAVGYIALQANTGSNNTAVGSGALKTNIIASRSTAVGFDALYKSTGGTDTALGYEALFNNSTAADNVAVGNMALFSNTIGANNSAFGDNALYGFAGSSATDSVAVGYQAGRYYGSGTSSNAAGTYETFLGELTRAGASGQTNETVVGYNALGNGSNTATLGNISVIGTWLNGTIHSIATAPVASVCGSCTAATYSTNAGGAITGLSTDTTVTLTFANSGWTNAAFCVALPSVSLVSAPYVSAISKTAVTFTFVALTGTLYYHCDGN